MSVHQTPYSRLLGYCVALGLCCVSLLLEPVSAQAQALEQPRHRQGYYVGLGFGNGVGHFWEDGKSLGTYPGGNWSLRVGQLLTRRLGLGLQIDIGGARKDQELVGIMGLGLEGQVVLVKNLALHAGVGLGVVQYVDERIENEELRGVYSTMYMAGLSYAFFPFADDGQSGGWTLTPVLQARFIPHEQAHAIAGIVGIEIGWWSGLPKHQLDLPESEAYER